MSYLRRAKLAIDSIRSLNSKAFTHRLSSQQFKQCTSSSNLPSKTPTTPAYYISSTRRTYCVGRNQIQHSRSISPQTWLLVKVITIANVCFVVVVVVPMFFVYKVLRDGSIETVPYTKRNRFLLLPSVVEKQVGEVLFENSKKSFDGKILPATHPHSVRVDSILTKIIQALETDAAQRFYWEVIVVDDPQFINFMCLPGGKIVVFTGLLQHFHTDAELATLIAHKVAHVVARHSVEAATKKVILGQIFYIPDVVRTMLRLLFSRRMEMEADYIGLLLQASAGYDPRVAPNVYEKLGQLGGDSPLKDYICSHPSAKKRARLLAEVMEEALAIYARRLEQDIDPKLLIVKTGRPAASSSDGVCPTTLP